MSCLEGLSKYAVPNCRELVDIGANIGRLRGRDLDRQLDRAGAAGVKRIIITGTSVKSSREASKTVLGNRNHASGVKLYFTAGVHPHDANTFNEDTIPSLEALLTNPLCVSVGETGLDYDRMRSDRQTQLRVFESLVQLAEESRKPMFIHERDVDAHRGPRLGSHDDLVGILNKYDVPPSSVCIHCFTADAASLKDYVSRGYYIGITGFLAMKNRGADLRASIKSGFLPLDRLMIETDAPYMKPDNFPKDLGLIGRNNEPCTLPALVRTLASCYGLPEEQVAAAATQNSLNFFSLS